jgi:hypothetical protein
MRVPGLVGYALLAELAGKNFWAFTVWENRDSLHLSGHQPAHRGS